MKKPFLLIAGENIYPNSETEDWVKCFPTEQEALDSVKTVVHEDYFKAGKRKGEVKSSWTTYMVDGRYGERECDWFGVVDLRMWADD